VVLSSEDVVGVSTGGTAWTSKHFHDANPKLYQAMLNPMQEGSEFIAAHPRENSEYYAADTKSKIDIDLMEGLLRDPRYHSDPACDDQMGGSCTGWGGSRPHPHRERTGFGGNSQPGGKLRRRPKRE
jgi:hypothetical protein